jgi:hypothetical protein
MFLSLLKYDIIASIWCRSRRMRGVVPPLPNTPSRCGALLSTGATLPLPYDITA